MEQHDRSIAVVHDRNRRYQGMVSVESLLACKEKLGRKEEGSIESAFEQVEPVQASTPLTEIMNDVADSPWPLPVVDENGRYHGTISRATLLHTLNRTEASAA